MANRTIYFGNIHPDATCEDICNAIRGGGILAKIRYLVDKHIAFITFVDPDLALHFCTTTNETGGIILKGRRLKLGWGKPSSLPGHVIQAIQNGGSRNVYLGNIHPHMTKDKLKQDFAEYGDIELVNCLKEKNCAFVNFTSIAAAIRAMDGIRTKEEYQGVRINYGKDRCGNPPKFMHQRKQHSETTPATTTATTATMPSLSSTLTLSSSSSSSSASSSSNGIVTPTTSDRSDQLAPHPSANVI
jgi:RNA recognition motif-containing protein